MFTPEGIFAADTEVLAHRLPTAVPLANTANPTVALARLRIDEAYARLDQAQLAWLPNLQGGTTYYRHDGEIQNATGVVFGTNKAYLFVGGTAHGGHRAPHDALFVPLIARRLVDAQSAASRAITNSIQLDVALAYMDLLQTYAQLAVNAQLLALDREVVRRAEVAERTGAGQDGGRHQSRWNGTPAPLAGADGPARPGPRHFLAPGSFAAAASERRSAARRSIIVPLRTACGGMPGR